jgi:ribosomal protein L12E/L44/L45/RPP1/RPP2
MPLKIGFTKRTFGKNIKTLMHEGRSQKQAVAIAYSIKKKASKKSKKRK